MNDDFYLGLSLLAVGMITVFTILTVVVVLGNYLIKFVNKYYPGLENATTTPVSEQTSSGIEDRKISAIIAAVSMATRGKGKITSIKKVE
jgi:oxaloacetate decarboxylase (Na+ extruding) subunit gamma